MSNITVVLGIATGILSVFTFLGGALAYIKASSRKAYAAERDFNHLKNSLGQTNQNLGFLVQELDKRFDSIDLKLVEISSRIEHETISIWGKKRDSD